MAKMTLDEELASRKLSRSPPKLLFVIFIWIANLLQKILDTLLPPPQRVLQKSLAFIDSHIILVSVKLGIADALGSRKASVDELAAELGDLLVLLGSCQLLCMKLSAAFLKRLKDGPKNSSCSLHDL